MVMENECVLKLEFLEIHLELAFSYFGHKYITLVNKRHALRLHKLYGIKLNKVIHGIFNGIYGFEVFQEIIIKFCQKGLTNVFPRCSLFIF